jgi:hypothetical protein
VSEKANTGEERSLSLEEFRWLEGLSRSSMFKIRRLGLGPRTYCVPGTRIIRITPAARAEWHERMHNLGDQEAASLERQRRSELASRAGRAAAASPRHVSKRRRDATSNK